MSARPIIHVHHRGDPGVDGILRLIELAGHDGPLEAMLTAMCDQIAMITGVDVVSIYAREDQWGDDRLVMRGNHGFPAAAIGTVALAVGEGITGLVAECLRPISAARAATESAYKHVPGLGEENYPVFAGIPLVGAGAAIGVLVLQRREKPFTTDEVTLATALAAPITLAVERRRASAVRAARLAGVTQVATHAVLGRAALVPTATAFDAREATDAAPATGTPATAPAAAPAAAPATGTPATAPVAAPAAVAPAASSLDRAFARLRDDLGRAIKRLASAEEPAIGAALDRLALALCDARLREQLATTTDRPASLRAVAKEYARASYRLGRNDPAAAADIEELCALLGDPRGLRPGAIWIADRIGAFVALVAVARGATALIASDAIAPTAIAIARAARMPAVSDVAGLFGWVRPGDLLAVDGEHVLVHPAPSDIERLRRARR